MGLVRKSGFAVLALALLMTVPGAASDSDWEKIGSKEFKAAASEESMRIGVEEGFFRWLKFGAAGGKIDLKKVTVQFVDGDDEVFENFTTIKDGGETRPITIAAAIKKTVKRIDFDYEIKDDAEQVKVTAYGRKGD